MAAVLLACVAWRFWLGALSNKGGRGQRNREEIGAEAAAPAPGSTKPPCYAGYRFIVLGQKHGRHDVM